MLTGLVYALAITGFAQVVFPHQAERLDRRGERQGGRLGAASARPSSTRRATRSRSTSSRGPSAATTNSDAGYDPSLSLGSNLGPTNPCFVKDPHEPCLDDDGKKIPPIVVERVKAYRELNGLGPNTLVPVDAVTASASGLDPHISIANARVQAKRVAERARDPARRRCSR